MAKNAIKIPEGWREVRLEEIVNICTGKKDVNEGNPSGKYPFFSCSQKILKSDNFSFDAEAILVAGNGDFNVKYYQGKFEAYQRTYVITNKENNNLKFVFHVLARSIDKITENNQGSTIKYIKIGDLQNFKFLLPPLIIQNKIAEILGAVDEEVDLVNSVVERSEKLRSSQLNRIFVKKDKVVKLGDMVMHVGSGSTPKGGDKVYLEEGIPFVRSQNVYFDGLRTKDLAYVSKEIHGQMKRTKVFNRDVLLNITGASIGRACVVPNGFPEANVSQHVCIIRPKEKLLPEFLFYFLQSVNGQNQIMSLQAGGNRQGLNFQQIRSFKIFVPSLEEQKKSINILFALDNKILIYKKIKNNLIQLKKGLMTDLLSGKVKI